MAIYRFNPDGSGEFVFESVTEGWISLIHKQSQRPELSENVSECSAKDLATPPVADTYLQDTEGGSFSRCKVYQVCNDIYNSGFSDCYIKILEIYQAIAYAIAHIVEYIFYCCCNQATKSASVEKSSKASAKSSN
ncbi:hypothetical protein [Nostoc sp. DedQUE09]|uniref:hypothetical protein n=1 Tax=Nostoc sp. DedQUE09 TaxID=3075394 RepID=UPI003A1013B3